MIESMWVWGALGLVLLALEMATGTLYIVWFGIAAICVSIAMWVFPQLPVAIQFAMFAVLSLGALAIWKLHYQKTETHSRVGQAQGEEIGRVGTVIEAVSPQHNGKIRFAQGLMGSREWTAVSAEPLEIGSDAVVTAVEGNALRIARHHH